MMRYRVECGLPLQVGVSRGQNPWFMWWLRDERIDKWDVARRMQSLDDGQMAIAPRGMIQRFMDAIALIEDGFYADAEMVVADAWVELKSITTNIK